MKKNIIKIAYSLTITVVIFIFFFKGISWTQVKEAFAGLSTAFLVVYIVFSMVSAILRTIQYWILLDKKLPLKVMFPITLVRNFSVDLLPARTAALFLYTFMARKRGVHIATGASSFVVSAVYGVISTFFLLSVLALFTTTQFNKALLMALLLALLIVCIMMLIYADGAVELLLKIPMLKKWKRINNFFSETLVYLQGHQQFQERLTLFALNLVIRILKYFSAYLLFEGVVRAGFSMSNFAVFSMGLATAELSAILPIQGLGGLGTWEAAFTLIFSQLAIDSGVTFITGLVLHVVSQSWEYSIGIIAFLYFMIFKVDRNKEKQS